MAEYATVGLYKCSVTCRIMLLCAADDRRIRELFFSCTRSALLTRLYRRHRLWRHWLPWRWRTQLLSCWSINRSPSSL